MNLKINLIEFNTRKNKVTMTIDEFKRLEKLARKQIEMKVKPIKTQIAYYDDFDVEDSFVCPICENYIGRMVEDCFEIHGNYCSECGQAIQTTYTVEEIKEIEVEFDNAM